MSGASVHTARELFVPAAQLHPEDQAHLQKHQHSLILVKKKKKSFLYNYSPTLTYKTGGDQTGDMAASHNPRETHSFGKYSD